MTNTATPDAPARHDLVPRSSAATRALVLGATALLLVAALVSPSLVANELDMTMSMGMTHYMELLATNQPRNLLLFMAVPVILAETLAITEIALLFKPGQPAWVRRLQRAAGLAAGPIMAAIVVHLSVNAVIPLTLAGGWRGPVDVAAVLFYLSGALPLVGITVVELGLLGATDAEARRHRAVFISAFLVVAHVAMILGMLDPAVVGYAMHHH